MTVASQSRGLIAAAIILCLTFACAWMPDARAQGLSLGSKSDRPLEVYADNGIEWDQNGQRYVARGNAKAIQGNTTVYADTLIAYYEEVEGNSEIYRMDAIGNVRIISRDDTSYGDHAVYDVRRNVMVLTGNNLRYVTPQEIITARDTLEYYELKQMAVARGNAKARPLDKADQRIVQADVLAVLFGKPGGAPQGGGGRDVERMDAYGNVIITRPGEIARSARAVYFPDKDTANLWGNVRLTRGDNQFNGDRAEVNFKTGISRLMSEKKGAPVKGLIATEELNKSKPATPEGGSGGSSQSGGGTR